MIKIYSANNKGFTSKYDDYYDAVGGDDDEDHNDNDGDDIRY